MNNHLKLAFDAGAQEAQQSFNPKLAFDAGAQQALVDAGLVKHADPLENPRLLGENQQDTRDCLRAIGMNDEADRYYRQLPDVSDRTYRHLRGDQYDHQWASNRNTSSFYPGVWKYVDDPNTPDWYDKRDASGWDTTRDRLAFNDNSRGLEPYYITPPPSDFFNVRGGTSRTPTFPEPPLPIPTAEEQQAQMSIPDEDLPSQSTPGPVSY